MAGDEAVRGAREAAVGDQGDVPDAAALERRRYLQHFAHAGAAARPLVADDNDVAFADRAALNGVERSFFAIEHAGWAFEARSVMADKFDHRAIGGDVAIDHGVGAARHHWRAKIADDFLAWRFDGFARFDEKRTAGDRGRIDDLPGLHQALQHQARAAGLKEVMRQELSAWSQVADDRCGFAGGVAVLDAERHASFSGDRHQVQHRVGRAAAGGDSDGGVTQ